MPITQLRIARPVSDLDRSVEMYCAGLGLAVLGSFRGHRGFDGTLVGEPGAEVHFEFVVCRDHPVDPSPTPEDLVVLYVPDSSEWAARCSAAAAAGFKEVRAFNPYWSEKGRTFEDSDGYRVVLQNAAWRSDGDSHAAYPADT